MLHSRQIADFEPLMEPIPEGMGLWWLHNEIATFAASLRAERRREELRAALNIALIPFGFKLTTIAGWRP